MEPTPRYALKFPYNRVEKLFVYQTFGKETDGNRENIIFAEMARYQEQNAFRANSPSLF